MLTSPQRSQYDIVAVVGPTASGKSDLAVALAQRWGGEVLICDAYQLRDGLPILTAKPTLEEQRGIPHHLLGVFPMREPVTAAAFVGSADPVIATLRAQGRPVIVCGGTGLYLRALCRGLFAGPLAHTGLREELRTRRESEGTLALYAQLVQVDPVVAARIAPQDYVRIERALEVFLLTGRPISDWHAESQQQPERYRAFRIGLDPGTDVLRERIRQRVERMFERGVLDEVAAYHAWEGIPVGPPLGYELLLAVQAGTLGQQQASEQLITQTAQYARRQRTWFRKEPDIHWFASPEETMRNL